MRHPVNSLVAELRRSADTSREVQAAVLYGQEAIRAAMVKAAGLGFEHATIPGPEGLNLSDTDAAKAAVAWLVGEKIEARFRHRDGAAGIEDAGTYDLVLTWKVPATGEGGGVARVGGGSTVPGAN